MPAQAGVQRHLNFLGSRVRENDENDESGGFSDFPYQYRT